MEKLNINGLIIVEGKDDKSFLSSFINSEFLLTNGYNFKDIDIDFINRFNENKKVILLTDSDEAGNKIRASINKKCPNLININIPIESCNKNNKHGVAEADKNVVIKLLKPYSDKEYIRYKGINPFIFLKFPSFDKEKMCQDFKLGYCTNLKQIIKRLNLLEIPPKKVINYFEGN